MQTIMIDPHFTVHLVREGQNYGTDGKLRHDKADPFVEFYDNRSKGGGFGRLVNRYYKSALLEGKEGLTLDASSTSWSVPAESMGLVRHWLKTFD